MADENTTTTTTSAHPDAKYARLFGRVDYDHEAAEQLAEALNEIATLERRANQLKQIVAENEELHDFVWRSGDGETGQRVIAIHNLEDGHLSNIMMYLLRHDRAIPRAIRGEAIRRNLVIPTTVSIDWTDELEPKRIARAKDRRDI